MTLLLAGCGSGETEKAPAKQAKQPVPVEQKCQDCHPVSIDPFHSEIACTDCHGGKSIALTAEAAHENFVKFPAHPDNMEKNCAPCHAAQVQSARLSSHFTLKNEVNTVRMAFGAEKELQTLADIPQHEEINSILGLAEDMLRRRCLRCHVYYPGEQQYEKTVHGTGCAACHMQFKEGSIASHSFIKSPTDEQCLSCHNGNFVGADYYGLYEHDFHWDFRTPYQKDGSTPRPYGVDYHQLSPDIHKTAGLACIDCHAGSELMGSSPARITCASCHLWQEGDELPLDNVRAENASLFVVTRHEQKNIRVPKAIHPTHSIFKEKADCTVCHAQWAFTDEGTHLMRLDVEEFDPWEALYVQGSYEVENQLFVSLFSDDSYPYIFMTDKITNELYTGIWLKGFELRRWEFPIVCKDDKEILRICRPLLDLHLSFVNEDEELVFDAVSPQNAPLHGLLPYTPHTTGKAGAFYTERLHENTDLLIYPFNLPKAGIPEENL